MRLVNREAAVATEFPAVGGARQGGWWRGPGPAGARALRRDSIVIGEAEVAFGTLVVFVAVVVGQVAAAPGTVVRCTHVDAGGHRSRGRGRGLVHVAHRPLVRRGPRGLIGDAGGVELHRPADDKRRCNGNAK